MSSAGSGLTTPSPTRESNSSLRNLVRIYCSDGDWLGLPADIVPATYMKKRGTTAVKVTGEEDEEKPTRPTEDGSRPTGLGRGQRWSLEYSRFKRDDWYIAIIFLNVC